MKHTRPHPWTATRRGNAGFTLLEVILAIAIGSVVLIALLTFYHQTALTRQSLIEESRRLAGVRLVMERITSELRTACRVHFMPTTLSGQADRIEFTTAVLPSQWSLDHSLTESPQVPESDLRRVRYEPIEQAVAEQGDRTVFVLDAAEETDGAPASTVVVGLRRIEQRLLQAQATEDGRHLISLPITEDIRFMRFRYWDGAAWTESWSDARLPLAVEIRLGFNPLPEETLPDDYSSELFRRTVFLPTAERPTPAGPTVTDPESDDTEVTP